MAKTPKSATPTSVIGYTIEYTVATNKVVHATDDNSIPKKYVHSPSLSVDELNGLCLEVVAKAINAYNIGQAKFDLLITPAGKIYPDPGFSP